MPDSDPYAEGLDARLAGQPETANPYDPDEDFDAYTAWFDGWASEDSYEIRLIASQCGFRLRSGAARACDTISGRDLPEIVSEDAE